MYVNYGIDYMNVFVSCFVAGNILIYQSKMGKAATGKPKGRMSSYAFFVQTCREEHKKKHPGENVVFAEFTKKCAEKWKVNLV